MKNFCAYFGDDEDEHVFSVYAWNFDLLDYRVTNLTKNLPIGCIGILYEHKRRFRRCLR